MAIFHFHNTVFSRSEGHSAVRGAAYRAGEKLTDTRTGEIADFTRKRGVLHAEILAPSQAPEWVTDRAALWNAVERAEDKSTRRADAQLAYSLTLALPAELDEEQRRDLVRGFVRERFVARGMVADIAFHAPDADGDDRNYHAHIMLTMRRLTADGFGPKAREWHDQFGRFACGRLVETHQLVALRAAWAEHTNAALDRAGYPDVRIDHRSLEAQGEDREATVHLGPHATALERRGRPSARGDENRAVAERNAAEGDTDSAEVIDLAAARAARNQARQDASQAEAPGPDWTLIVTAYKTARAAAGQLWSAIWQDVGGDVAETADAKTQAHRRAFRHADYPAYAEARTIRNAAALEIAADPMGAAAACKAQRVHEGALAADIVIARGGDRRAAEAAQRDREQAAALARLERQRDRVERAMAATAARLRGHLTAAQTDSASVKAADILKAITTYAPTFGAAELAALVQDSAASRDEARAIARAVLDSGALLDLYDPTTGAAAGWTTRAHHDREAALLQDGACLTARTGYAATGRGVRGAIAARTLRPEQEMALRHACSGAALSLIDGKAGTGKSYVLGAIRAAYEAHTAVIGLAPTREAAAGLRGEGFRTPTTAHSFLGSLETGKLHLPRGAVLVVDEAAMLDTDVLGRLTHAAATNQWKLILCGDDRQLASVAAGGMFAALRTRHGAATLAEVVRQRQESHRAASRAFAAGDFAAGLAVLDREGVIHFADNAAAARAALVQDWAAASAARPEALRFVFAYTNADVRLLNADIRAVRVARGEIEPGMPVQTAHSLTRFAAGDRIAFTQSSRALGIDNGNAGTVLKLDDTMITVRIDGAAPRAITFPHQAFNQFRHGYAGTIYKGQGKTIDEALLLHSAHWRAAGSYVALTRHRQGLGVYVARETAADVATLAKLMGRAEGRDAAHRYRAGTADRAADPRDQLAGEIEGLLHPTGPQRYQGLRAATPAPMPAPAHTPPAAPPADPQPKPRAKEVDDPSRSMTAAERLQPWVEMQNDPERRAAQRRGHQRGGRGPRAR